jgi:uncharacterized protein
MGFGALIIGGFFMLIGWMVSARLKSKFKEYSQTHLSRDLTGAEIARLMLADNGIHDVQVVSVEGQLTDHYNPATKTVNLSEGVYHGRNAAATAVAAHSAGTPFSMPPPIRCFSFARPWCPFRTSAPAC